LLFVADWDYQGTGLGAKRAGIANPIQAEKRLDGVGIGADADPTAVSDKDDEFTQYKKRMALSYRFRPNPLVHDCCLSDSFDSVTETCGICKQNNPRKQYY